MKKISPGRYHSPEVKRLDYTVDDECPTCLQRTYQKVSERYHIEIGKKVIIVCTVCGTTWLNGVIQVSG